MDSSQFRTAAHAAIEEIIQYHDTLSERPVLPSVSPGYLGPLLPNGPPTEGEEWSNIQADIDKLIMPGLTHWQSPKFMAFFPCNSSYPAMLGDLYSGAFNAAAFNWICSPAITELETVMMDWVAKAIALPDCFLSKGEGGGIIQGTASEVIVTALVAARERYIRRKLAHLEEGEEKMDQAAKLRGKMIALGSEHAHSSTQKGAVVAGTRFRTVPAPRSANFSVTASALTRTLEECKAKGLEPFYFTATLGSTATCAVDDLAGIADMARAHPDLWIHVDAAYAGSALFCPEYQHLCPPLSRFDSFNFNLHKWALVNFDCSAFYVRRRADLIDTFSILPSYLRNEHSASGLVTDYRDWQIPLGRRFRSLKVWFVLRTYGTQGLADLIRKHIQLGTYFADLLRTRTDLFAVVTEPAFGLVTFHIVPRARDISGAGRTGSNGNPGRRPLPAHEADLSTPSQGQEDGPEYRATANALTKEVYERVGKQNEFFFTGTEVCGVYLIRVVSATLHAEEKYLERAFDLWVGAVEGVLGERAGG